MMVALPGIPIDHSDVRWRGTSSLVTERASQRSLTSSSEAIRIGQLYQESTAFNPRGWRVPALP